MTGLAEWMRANGKTPNHPFWDWESVWAGVAARYEQAKRLGLRLALTPASFAAGCHGCHDQDWNMRQPPGTPPLRCAGCPVTRLRREARDAAA